MSSQKTKSKSTRKLRPKNSAERTIDKFGGTTAASRALNCPATTIDGWKKRGFIPPQRINDIREVAFRMGIGLSAADFIPDFDPKAGKAKEEDEGEGKAA